MDLDGKMAPLKDRLVEETKRGSLTDAVERLDGRARGKLAHLGFELSNHKLYANRAGGDVQLAWRVGRSRFGILFSYHVTKRSGKGRPWGEFDPTALLHDHELLAFSELAREEELRIEWASFGAHNGLRKYEYHYIDVILAEDKDNGLTAWITCQH